MKASDLRIGNLIMYSNGSILFKVIGIHEFGVDIENEVETTYIEYDEFETILITDEWLVKFGFEKSRLDNNRWFRTDEIVLEYSYGYVRLGMNSIRVKTEFVHDMQNLISGLKLKIDETKLNTTP